MDFASINEILFLASIFGGLGLALGASYFGRAYLVALILTITLYMNIAEANVIEVFGLPTTLGTALYGVIFFATDLLTERYGKTAGYQAIRLSIFATILFHVIMQMTLLTHAIPDMQWFAEGMNTVFTMSLRIAVASVFVFTISQHFDVWFYHRIQEWTGDKHLWLRNNGSTFVSQALDSYLFGFLAFYGVFDDWLMLATVGYGFKLAVAACDTGFMYAARWFTPRDLMGLKEHTPERVIPYSAV